MVPPNSGTLTAKSSVGGLPLVPLDLPQRTRFFISLAPRGVHLRALLQEGDIGPKVTDSYLRPPILVC